MNNSEQHNFRIYKNKNKNKNKDKNKDKDIKNNLKINYNLYKKNTRIEWRLFRDLDQYFLKRKNYDITYIFTDIFKNILDISLYSICLIYKYSLLNKLDTTFKNIILYIIKDSNLNIEILKFLSIINVSIKPILINNLYVTPLDDLYKNKTVTKEMLYIFINEKCNNHNFPFIFYDIIKYYKLFINIARIKIPNEIKKIIAKILYFANDIFEEKEYLFRIRLYSLNFINPSYLSLYSPEIRFQL